MRRLLAAVLAVALLGACDGSGGGSNGGSGGDADRDPDGTTASGPSSSTTTPTETGPIVKCPGRTQEIDPGLPDAVPEGATSVRLCDGGADKVAPPDDALTTDVGSVVEAVNAQPLAKKGCVDLRIPEYQLAFGYPDGSRFVVAGRFTACAELLVGSARRKRAAPPLRTFVESLQAQRSTETPPEPTATPGELDCAQPETHLPAEVGRPTDLAVAVLCVGALERPATARRVTIPPDDLTVLVESMGTDTVSTDGMFCPIPFSGRWIVGVTAWGDPVTMPHGCAGLNLQGSLDWIPRGKARRVLQHLTEQAH